MKLASVRTSASHPLRVDAMSVGATGGLVGMTLCPGKQGDSVFGGPWRRDLQTDLQAIARWGAVAVVSMIEDHEFALLGVENLGEGVAAHSIEWYRLPIPDLCAPGTQFHAAWPGVARALMAHLAGGRKVLLHCRGGLGRAGTVAALLAIEFGATPSSAVQRVRAARPGAIDIAQEEFLMGYRPMAQAPY